MSKQFHSANLFNGQNGLGCSRHLQKKHPSYKFTAVSAVLIE